MWSSLAYTKSYINNINQQKLMYELNKEELKVLKPLSTPRKIQDFINKIPVNFETRGETCMSPRRVLKENKAHCIEGAILAAAILRLQGHKPLIVDLTAAERDDDHVIAVFKQHGHWGAISKTNHVVLRYREPVYKTVRELVMSYFHEYFDDKGRKNLRSFSMPVDLSRFDDIEWVTSENDLWDIANHLVEVPHNDILTRPQIATLRKADKIELKVDYVDWRTPIKLKLKKLGKKIKELIK